MERSAGGRCQNYQPMSWPRLRILPWIRLSILPSTRSHRSPAFRFCLGLGVDQRISSFKSFTRALYVLFRSS